jgi:hypothetical protein
MAKKDKPAATKSLKEIDRTPMVSQKAKKAKKTSRGK